MAEKDFTRVVHNYLALYFLASDIAIPELRNQSIDMIQRISVKYNMTATSLLVLIWKNTTPGSPLRWYFMDRCISALPPGATKNPDQYPKEMLLEMVAIMAEYGRKGDLSGFKVALNMEKYHV
jgi:hypothetical protein